jgi:hypothetical protein
MSLQIVSYIALGFSFLALLLSIWSLWSGNKFKDFAKIFNSDSRPDNLEEVLSSITETIKKLSSDQSELKKFSEELANVLQTAYRYSSVVRFNSTGTDGGNLSFSAALLDSNQNGFIITSLHGREQNRIYCKAVASGQGLQPLNEEEQQAIIEALTNNNKINSDK